MLWGADGIGKRRVFPVGLVLGLRLGGVKGLKVQRCVPGLGRGGQLCGSDSAANPMMFASCDSKLGFLPLAPYAFIPEAAAKTRKTSPPYQNTIASPLRRDHLVITG